ncbi:MAG: hypothetical protein KDD41_13670 [Flavobacteriales bacterium]|nr:hypothetical protein [Flavobacteriales bacterium]
MKTSIVFLFLIAATSAFSQKESKAWIKKDASGVVIEKGFYKNKKQDGEWNYFYPDGKPSLTATYHEGVLEGKSLRYDLQGNVIAELNYTNGKLTGKQIYYYQNGAKLSEGEMINGKEEGAWRYFNQKGEYMGIIKYKNGKQLDEQMKTN